MHDENACLRALSEADLERVLQWRNSERIRAVMFNDRIITPDEHRQWFDQINQQDVTCLIFEWQDRPVGLVSFTATDTINKKCYWGFYLGEEGLPAGTGLIMGRMGLRYAFETLGMRKVCSEVLVFNLSSIRYHQKLGFAEEGLLKKHVWKNGQYTDVVSLAILADQWLESVRCDE